MCLSAQLGDHKYDINVMAKLLDKQMAIKCMYCVSILDGIFSPV